MATRKKQSNPIKISIPANPENVWDQHGTLRIGSMRITVHTHILYEGMRLSIYNPNLLDNVGLVSTDIESAKKEALEVLKTYLESLLHSVEGVVRESA